MLQIPAKMLLVFFSVTTFQRHGQFPAAAAFAILSTNLWAYFLRQKPAPLLLARLLALLHSP